MDFETYPATPDRWADVEAVLSDAGTAAKCWCAYWYLPNRDCQAGWGTGNKWVLRDRIEGGLEPGVIAYVDDAPAGWAGIAPRHEFDRLSRSRPLAPVDDAPVWALNCFAIAKPFRRLGLMRVLLRAALDHAVAKGVEIVEAYPADDPGRKGTWDLYLGTMAAYREAGFIEVARRLPRRPILRWHAG